jgi:hypothetical protein
MKTIGEAGLRAEAAECGELGTVAGIGAVQAVVELENHRFDGLKTFRL